MRRNGGDRQAEVWEGHARCRGTYLALDPPLGAAPTVPGGAPAPLCALVQELCPSPAQVPGGGQQGCDGR